MYNDEDQELGGMTAEDLEDQDFIEAALKIYLKGMGRD